MSDSFTPTDEQNHVLDLIRGEANIMCNALAGTGKTATIKLAEAVYPRKPLLYVVFNKRNQEEAESKFEATTMCKTINAVGHNAWMKASGKNLSIHKSKIQDILRNDIIAKVPKRDQSPFWDCFWDVVNGVAFAKAIGYVPDGKFPTMRRLCDRKTFHAGLEEAPDDLVADLIDTALSISIKQAYDGLIDFNDQVYMAALAASPGFFPSFPEVAIDEYQDHNATGHEIIRMLTRKARLLGVGDPNQNIYGFRGAKHSGMADAIASHSMIECDLSISFRCPSEIVNHVHWHVPKFRAHRVGGHVEVLTKGLDVADIPDDSTFLCRNNAPLFKAALHLLSAKRSVSVAGSDIGPRLVSTMKKLGDVDMSRASLLDAIEDWRAEKLAKESKTAADMADCMRVFAGFASTLGGAIAYAEHLFAQRGAIKLMTGHKAKGLEFDNVYHLDPWLLSDRMQDRNLRYVISTRSRDALYEVDSRDIRW